jgi:phosphatidate cytidylyltransferase
LFVIIWVTDTSAWFFGKNFGRLKLAPNVSPKKTLEGAIGGLIVAMGVAWLYRESFLKEELGLAETLFYALVIILTGKASDLIESLMKRSFGVKDSSMLLPGHGGLLDRFDSFIFSTPIFYYLLIVSGRFQ